jgi:phosphatidylglycerol lysyltransferase
MPTAVTGADDVQQRVLALVLRHGWNATAFQTLGRGYTYFFHDDGCVAYVDTGSAWVVAGSPIAASESLAEITRAFVHAARAAGRRCCFFGTEERFLRATGDDMRALRIGEQPVWDPQRWPDTLAAHARLREQLRRARAKGVRVRAVPPDELEASPLGHATRELVTRWLATRAMPPLGFLVQVAPFTFSDQRRYFVAERDEHLVGVAYVIPVPQRSGWFIEHFVRAPHAPNGTVELLVDAVMRWASDAGCSWLTLGLAPLAGEVPLALRIARSRTRSLYDFEGLRRFKARLRPTEWHAIHVSHPATQGKVATVLDVLAAFATGGFLRFGARALARGPSVVVAVLAALLVPWILLLVAAPADVWFAGHAAVKWAWIGFDVLMLAGLVRLLRHPSPRLATMLALAASADALATPLEAALWNLPRIRGWLDGVVVALACIAPALAAVVLWGTRARLLRVARPAALHDVAPDRADSHRGPSSLAQ